jgi:hypothetical protein
MDYVRDLYEEQGEAPNLQGCFNVRPSFGEPVIDFHHRSQGQEPVPVNTLPSFVARLLGRGHTAAKWGI